MPATRQLSVKGFHPTQSGREQMWANHCPLRLDLSPSGPEFPHGPQGADLRVLKDPHSKCTTSCQNAELPNVRCCGWAVLDSGCWFKFSSHRRFGITGFPAIFESLVLYPPDIPLPLQGNVFSILPSPPPPPPSSGATAH
jgi:hypothetical protein